jgi:hypothetical protein
MKFLFDLDYTLNDEGLSETFLLAMCVESNNHKVVFISHEEEHSGMKVDNFIQDKFVGDYELFLKPDGDIRESTEWKRDLLDNMAQQDETILVNALNLSKHTAAVRRSQA